MLSLEGVVSRLELWTGIVVAPFLVEDQCAVSRYLARGRVGCKLLENCHVWTALSRRRSRGIGERSNVIVSTLDVC